MQSRMHQSKTVQGKYKEKEQAFVRQATKRDLRLQSLRFSVKFMILKKGHTKKKSLHNHHYGA